MFLKNYTSDVPVARSVYEIEQMLITCGVTGINKEYSAAVSGKVTAMIFSVPLGNNGRNVQIRLPADERGATDALWKEYVGRDKTALSQSGDEYIQWNGRKRLTRKSFTEQGERTAWRIVKDWVAIQLSMIQMRQAEFQQVFLPYAWDGHQTLFERMKDRGFLELSAPKEEVTP